jgi:hypothetical protein
MRLEVLRSGFQYHECESPYLLLIVILEIFTSSIQVRSKHKVMNNSILRYFCSDEKHCNSQRLDCFILIAILIANMVWLFTMVKHPPGAALPAAAAPDVLLAAAPLLLLRRCWSDPIRYE